MADGRAGGEEGTGSQCRAELRQEVSGMEQMGQRRLQVQRGVQ